MEMRTLVTKLLGPCSGDDPGHEFAYACTTLDCISKQVLRCLLGIIATGQYRSSDRCSGRCRFVSIGLGKAHLPYSKQTIVRFDDGASMVLVQRHAGSVRGKACLMSCEERLGGCAISPGHRSLSVLSVAIDNLHS